MLTVTKMCVCAIGGASAIVGLLLTGTPAEAGEEPMKCYNRAKLVAHLETKFGETQQSVGYEEGRGLVELFANRGSGSWTVLLTPHATTSCVLRSGQAAVDDQPERGA